MATHSTPPGPPPQPASQQDQPNSKHDDDNQSASSQQNFMRNRFINMFWSSNKTTNSQNTSSKSTIKEDSTVNAHRLSTVGNPQQEQAAGTGVPYPLRNILSLPLFSPIPAREHKMPSLESDLHQLQTLRLDQTHQAVYIPPMAKPSLKAKDNDLFHLMEKTQEFLASERQVMLVLGDSGAGKSTFNHHLEQCLWNDYKPGNPIPLFINLPAINRPDQDLVAKQLKFYAFSDDQIQEIKLYRQLILICDGYDESQQLVNLHSTNSLNRLRQWNTKMIISCRTQFLGPDYHSRFMPQGEGGHYDRAAPNLFQEAVIAPFSKAQIENYVKQYVPLEPRTWNTKDYMDRLTTIPNLLDLVRNPFLLSLALEALPGVTEGRRDLSAITITRVQLYDTFINHWLDVNKRRLERNNALSMDDRDMLNQLVNEGFNLLGLNYSTRLALAIFERQDGNPVVKYSHFSDKNTWKAEFFGLQPDVRLLRESSPLTRTGNLFRFVHRSMLEYFLSRVIYSPKNMTDDDYFQAIDEPAMPPSHLSAVPLLDTDGLLFRRNLLTEPSIIQFLCDRVKSNPDFEEQLRAVINQSKIDANATIAAANAITILVRAGVDFHGADLQGVKISGADLSEGQFDSAQLQGAVLTGANLSRSWLRQADLSNAQLEGVRFGELPYLEIASRVTSCAYSPDGTMLAVGCRDGLDVYNTATWKKIIRNYVENGASNVAFLPNNRHIVISDNLKKIRLFDCSSGMEDQVMDVQTGYLDLVAFSPCGKQLASASKYGSVTLWNSQTRESRFVLEVRGGYLMSVKFSSDGRQLVSGCSEGTIRFWDPKTGEPGLVLKSLLGEVKCLAYSHDGRWIVSGHGKGASQLWSAVSGEPGLVLRGHTEDVSEIAFSLNDQLIASSSCDHTVRLWDSSTGVCVSTLTGHREVVNGIAFSPDGMQLASGSADRRVRLWDISSIGWSVDLQEHHPGQNEANYSAKDLILLSSSNRSIRQWDQNVGALLRALHDMRQKSHVHSGVGLAGFSDVFFKAISTSGCQVALSYRNSHLVCIFDLSSRNLVKSKNLIRENPYTWTYSPNDQQLAIGSCDGPVYLWNFDQSDDELCAKLSGHQAGILSVAYSPCGHWIVSGSRDQTVRLWHCLPEGSESWSCVATVHGFFGWVYRVAWSPFIPMEFVTYCKDESVRIWRVSNVGGKVVVRMQWGPNLRMLCVEDLVRENATGLSHIQQKLLIQRSAVARSVVPEEDEWEEWDDVMYAHDIRDDLITRYPE